MTHAINIIWKTDTNDNPYLKLPNSVFIDKDLNEQEAKKWLLNRYGWHVIDLKIEKERET